MCLINRKITKKSPGAHIFQRTLFEGLIFGGDLYTEGFIKGGKFAFQNSLGLYLEGSFQCANDNIEALNRNSYVIYFGLFGIGGQFPCISTRGIYMEEFIFGIWRGDLASRIRETRTAKLTT